jgi:hypothetical protein
VERLHYEADHMLNWVTATHKTSARDYKLELKRQSSELHHPQFGVQHPRCSHVSFHSTVLNCECTVSQVTSTVSPTTCRETSVQNWLKMCDNAKAHSAETICILQHCRGEGVATPCLFSWPQSIWLAHYSQHETSTAWQLICKQIG